MPIGIVRKIEHLTFPVSLQHLAVALGKGVKRRRIVGESIVIGVIAVGGGPRRFRRGRQWEDVEGVIDTGLRSPLGCARGARQAWECHLLSAGS